MATTTIGKLLLEDAIPEEYRGSRVLDSKGLQELLNRVAEKNDPEEYNRISKALMDVGRSVTYRANPAAFHTKDLRTPVAAYLSRTRLNRKIKSILRNKRLSPDEREAQVVAAAKEEQEWLKNEVMAGAQKDGNSLARDITIGARGNPGQLQGLIAGGDLFTDAKGRIIPIPVTRSLAEGRSLAQYWAGTYGGRTGLIGTKLSVADGGYLSKRLIAAAHRLMAVAEDDEKGHDPNRGLPVDSDDNGNIGALLARETAGFPQNTVITPKVLEAIRNKGVKRMLVRSPLVGGPASGLYARDIGIRERGTLPELGEVVGNPAVQSSSEKLTQGALSSKHSGGVAGAGPTGLALVNQLVEHPQNFMGGAAHAQNDGKVTKISEAPQGGWYIEVDGKQHYADVGHDPTVKVGDVIEAGDVLTKGLPNPEEVIKHKGIGEGSRAFTHQFHKALKDSGIGNAERRNIELVVRGLVDHVEMTEADDEYVPGDVVSYRKIENSWKPRESARELPLVSAEGLYLEKPVLHYSLGTQLKPSMLKELKEFGIENVTASAEPLPFKPRMLRASVIPQHDEDYMTRMLGGYQEKSLLDAVHRGGHSDTASTSFVPALAEGKNFGSDWPKNVIKKSPGMVPF